MRRRGLTAACHSQSASKRREILQVLTYVTQLNIPALEWPTSVHFLIPVAKRVQIAHRELHARNIHNWVTNKCAEETVGKLRDPEHCFISCFIFEQAGITYDYIYYVESDLYSLELG